MTTVAVLQLVERGLVDLDEDITRVLHEWKDAKILTSFDDNGKPITLPAKNKMTLRQLLTHSSGMGYNFINRDIQRYRQVMGLPTQGEHLMEVFFDPLLYEPGEGWAYSPSVDWAGVVVERIGGCGRLEEYMIKNIWDPLGITAATFRLNDREDINSNLVQMLARTEDGRLTTPTGSTTSANYKFDSGGGGIFTRPTEFVKLLSSLLCNDETILKKETVEMMFTPQLPDTKYLRAFMDKSPTGYSLLRGLPLSIDYNWGLGGLLTLQDVPGRRRGGSLMWGGLPNLSWWIDRKSDLYTLYSSQVLPTGDRPLLKLAIMFENVLYQDVAV